MAHLLPMIRGSERVASERQKPSAAPHSEVGFTPSENFITSLAWVRAVNFGGRLGARSCERLTSFCLKGVWGGPKPPEVEEYFSPARPKGVKRGKIVVSPQETPPPSKMAGSARKGGWQGGGEGGGVAGGKTRRLGAAEGCLLEPVRRPERAAEGCDRPSAGGCCCC